MVRALRPFVGEAIDCDPADYLDALQMHGMRVDSEADALWPPSLIWLFQFTRPR